MPVRLLTIRAYLDDVPLALVNEAGAFSRTQTFGQGVSTASLTVHRPYKAPQAGQRVRVEVGWDGATSPRFTGVVVTPRRLSFPQDRWVLSCADLLWYAEEVKMDISLIDGSHPTANDWNAREACTVLLRDFAGIDESLLALPELETADGVPWVLATLTPFTVAGQSVLQIVQAIYGALGYWVYCDPAGIVRAIQMSGAPSEAAAHTYTESVDLLIDGAPEYDQDYSQVYNQVEVRGANTGVEGAQLVDRWQVNHPLLPANVYHMLSYQNQFLEYENAEDAGAASVTEVAKRMLKQHSRLPLAVRARVKGDATLHVGKIIGIDSDRLGVSTTFFLYGLSESAGAADWSVQLTLDGGINPDDGYPEIPPPIAAFTYLLHRETLDGTAYIEVFCDGGASYSPSGEIVSYAWADTDAHTGAGRYWSVLYPAAQATATITLTVVDTTSKSDSHTLTIPLTGDAQHAPSTRTLSVAAGSTWYVTPDGGATWRTATGGDAIAVPPIGPEGGLTIDTTIGMLATGGSSGVTIRETLDQLATAPTTIATIGEQVLALWHNEQEPSRVWAGTGTGAVYRSLDGGTTWALRGTLPAAVRAIIEAPSLATVEAIAGGNVYWSTDQGGTFALVLEGPS